MMELHQITCIPPLLAWLVGVACALTIFVRAMDLYRWLIIVWAAWKGAKLAGRRVRTLQK